ncbi:MAG: hypothetical protein LBD07_04450 [Spirochaetaceae bacterium]|jgi:hypothetical protein|nr:hypothetical protein [Spirochaetaceae bacterium]
MPRGLLFILLVFITGAAAAQPVYVSGGGGFENLTIDTLKLGRSDDYYSLMHLNFFGVVEGDFDKNYSYKLSYQNDPFWQNTVKSDFGVRLGVIAVDFGVQAGAHNSDSGYKVSDIEFWDLGVDGGVRLEFSGFFFTGFNFTLDIGGNAANNKIGGAERQMIGFFGGFWLPNILISGNYYRKDYNEKINDAVSIHAAYSKIGFKMEFFAKNIFYRLALKAGTITQTCGAVSGNNSSDLSENKHFYIGADFTVDLSRRLSWFINAEAPVLGLRAPIFMQFTAVSGVKFRCFENR